MPSKRTLSATQAQILAALDEQTARSAAELPVKGRVAPHLIAPGHRGLARTQGTRRVNGRTVSAWVRTSAGTVALRRWQRIAQIAAAAQRMAVAS